MPDIGYASLDLLEQGIGNVVLALETGNNSALYSGEVVSGKTGSQ